MATTTTSDLANMTMAELLAHMDDAARRVLENAAACSSAAGSSAPSPAAEVAGIGDGRDVVTVAPQASPAREVELATEAALGAGLDPRRAARDAQLAIVDRLLARARVHRCA
jgi:hypothetical protein